MSLKHPLKGGEVSVKPPPPPLKAHQKKRGKAVNRPLKVDIASSNGANKTKWVNLN